MLEGLVKVKVDNGPKFPVETILQLACAAQRVNKDYIKETQAEYSQDGKFLYLKHANKMAIMVTLDPKFWTGDPKDQPFPLKITQDDVELAAEIKKYFRKFMFAAIQGENEFQTEVNALLSSETMSINRVGYIACLPSTYKRDYNRTQFEKRVKTIDEDWLGEVGQNLVDLDCEILGSIRSKNFDAWNIDAIINNRMVSWMSKVDLKVGPCVIVKAKVKDHTKHWKLEKPVTRLNYVKAAQ